MIMVQKPVHLLSSPSTHHHRRHPSAPPTVLVQPTRIPGLLSLSKPAPVTPTRPQQQQQHHQNHQNHQNRQSRSTHSKTKPTSTARHSSQSPAAAAQPQPTDDLNKPFPSSRPPAKSNNTVSTTLSPSPEKPPRGRQNSKQSKDKSKSRSNSQSLTLRNNNRRHQSQLHQGSPPIPSHLPSQAEVSDKSTSARPARQHNLFDPFLASSESDSDNPPSTPSKGKAPVRPAPKLSPRPNGKLARRRQNIAEVPFTPTPTKTISVPHSHPQPPSWQSHPLSLSRSVPTLSSMQSGEATVDVFPICDDLTDVEDDDVFAPSTPARVGAGHVTWQATRVYDDGPRTAPLSHPRSSFSSNPKPTSTPTPESKHQHARSPSEGVFSLSMDEDCTLSLSDPSSELKSKDNFPPRRRIASAASTPMGTKRDFWASSKFQNSPSPDVLPIPAFKAQAAL